MLDGLIILTISNQRIWATDATVADLRVSLYVLGLRLYDDVAFL